MSTEQENLPGVVIDSYRHPDDYLPRLELLEAAGLAIPARDDFDRIEELIARRPDAIKIARVKGRMVGAGYLSDYLLTAGLVVAPDMRGRGIGKLLMAALAEQARAEGHPQMEVQVDDPAELGGYYEEMGFERSYDTTGYIMPLDPPERELIEEGAGELTRERVRRAFMTLYPIEDISSYYEYNHKAERQLWMMPQGLSQVLRDSSIPSLRHAYFMEESSMQLTTAAWFSYSTETRPYEQDSVVCWARRFWGHRFHQAKEGYCFEPIPNNAHLFLRMHTVSTKGRPGQLFPSDLDVGGLMGDYVCYDQANDVLTPFTIGRNDDEGPARVMPMSEEEAARTTECMVACAEAFRSMLQGKQVYIQGSHGWESEDEPEGRWSSQSAVD